MANAKPSKEILAFMEKYGVTSDEIWCVHGSKWVILHKALERAAYQAGVVWDRPAIIEHDAANKIAVICVFGKLGDREDWSIGEASPANNKNAYCYAMAEKRGKDRVILKLLNAHGSLYSEDEADDFKRSNPHVTRPEDIFDPVEHDQNGQPVDNIPLPSPDAVRKLKVSEQRPLYDQLQKEIHATGSPQDLADWAETNANRLGGLKTDWAAMLRGVYREHMDSLRAQDKQDSIRMAS